MSRPGYQVTILFLKHGHLSIKVGVVDHLCSLILLSTASIFQICSGLDWTFLTHFDEFELGSYLLYETDRQEEEEGIIILLAQLKIDLMKAYSLRWITNHSPVRKSWYEEASITACARSFSFHFLLASSFASRRVLLLLCPFCLRLKTVAGIRDYSYLFG